MFLQQINYMTRINPGYYIKKIIFQIKLKYYLK